MAEQTRRPKHKFDFEKNARTVFVGNLASDFDQKAITKLFKKCGPVESARIRNIVPAKETISPKVALIKKEFHPKVDTFNAYVVFKSQESIDAALKLNGKEVNGHKIRVDRASRPKAKKETLTSRKKSVFVGNLRFDLRDDDLIKHFEKHVGKVNYVRIVRDATTGAGKGFAFVVFDTRDHAKEALSLDETPLKGRNMRIKKVDKEVKEGKPNKQQSVGQKSVTPPTLDETPLKGRNMRIKKVDKEVKEGKPNKRKSVGQKSVAPPTLDEVPLKGRNMRIKKVDKEVKEGKPNKRKSVGKKSVAFVGHTKS